MMLALTYVSDPVADICQPTFKVSNNANNEACVHILVEQ